METKSTIGTKSITLGKASFLIKKEMGAEGKQIWDLEGSRGGTSALVQNIAKPDLWAHIPGNTRSPRVTWYKREGATFVAV